MLASMYLSLIADSRAALLEGRHGLINCFSEQIQKKIKQHSMWVVKGIMNTENQPNWEKCILDSWKPVSYHLIIDMI